EHIRQYIKEILQGCPSDFDIIYFKDDEVKILMEEVDNFTSYNKERLMFNSKMLVPKWEIAVKQFIHKRRYTPYLILLMLLKKFTRWHKIIPQHYQECMELLTENGYEDIKIVKETKFIFECLNVRYKQLNFEY